MYDPSTPPSVQSTLQRQLQLVQSSPSAWTIVGTLVSHPDSSVRFFGASTLQQAIARSWHSLDPNDPAPRTLTGPVSSLKESLLHWLATSAVVAYPAPHASASGTGTSGEKPVLRKLAAATTSLSLRLGGEWNDWLLEVIMRIAASGAAREASLEVLSTAIEEIARADFVGSQRCVSLLPDRTRSVETDKQPSSHIGCRTCPPCPRRSRTSFRRSRPPCRRLLNRARSTSPCLASSPTSTRDNCPIPS